VGMSLPSQSVLTLEVTTGMVAALVRIEWADRLRYE
jgi:hypothetical protein